MTIKIPAPKLLKASQLKSKHVSDKLKEDKDPGFHVRLQEGAYDGEYFGTRVQTVTPKAEPSAKQSRLGACQPIPSDHKFVSAVCRTDPAPLSDQQQRLTRRQGR